MTCDMTGKTALVTGAASGIGKACAEALAAAGAKKLILVDMDAAGLDALDLPCEIASHSGDVADEALWEAVEAEGGTLAAAIVNAGIAGEAAPIAKMDLANWRRVLGVNLDGAFLTLRSAMRMAEDGAGIVLTASSAGLNVEKGIAAYAASKAAVLHLAKVAAKEGAERGIRVNAIAPGGVDTAIWDSAPFFEDLVAKHQGDREGALRTMAQGMTPLGKFARAEDIAAQVMFLLSDAAQTITGTALVSDGGYSL